MNRYCNILFVLDPDHAYPKDLYREVRQAVYATLFSSPVLDFDAEPWLAEATKWLTDALTNPDNKDIDPDLKEEMFKEMEYLSKKRGESFDRTQHGQFAKNATDMMHLLVGAPKGVVGVKTILTGLWVAGGAGAKNNAIVQQTKFAQRGGKWAFIGKE